MANATFGFGPTRNNWVWFDGAIDNQVWDTAIVVSNVGRIVSLDAYFAGDLAAITGGPCLWSSGGVLLVDGSNHAVAQGSRASNGGVVVTHSGLDVPFLSPTTYFVGAFRNSADSWVIPFADNVGAYGTLKTVAGSTPGALSGGSTWLSQTGFTGGMQCHGTYFVVETYVRRSAAWFNALFSTWRTGSWGALPGNAQQTYVRRSGVWIQVGQLRPSELDWKREEEAIVRWPDGSWEPALMRWDYDRPRILGEHPAIIEPPISRPYKVAA